jgi:hypothetical protein
VDLMEAGVLKNENDSDADKYSVNSDDLGEE